MNYKLFSLLIFSVFLLSAVSAMTVYADFSDSSQSTTITVGDSVSFNADFFSMNPSMTMNVGLYDSSGNLIQTFLDSSTNEKTYSDVYTYTADTAGTYKITVSGTDSINTDSQTITLTVNPCPQPPINHAPVAQDQNIVTNQNTPITITLSATDKDNNPLTYSIVNNPSQGSLSNFNALTGQVKYTPNYGFSGSDSFTFIANDGTVNSNTATIYITVNSQNPTNHNPSITPISNQQIDEKQHYSYQVYATDSDGDTLTYSITQNPSTPSWLSISSTGLITGTAPSVDYNTNYNIEVKVSDGKGGIDTKNYLLTVKNIPCPPPNENPSINIISPQDKEYTTNQIYLKVETNDVVEGVKYTLNGGETYTQMDNSGINLFTDTIHVSDGEHFITFYPTDNDGNSIGQGQSVSFSVDTSNHNNEEQITGTDSVRVLSDDSYYLNKYYNQFSPGNVVAQNTTPSTSSNVSIISILVYVIIGIIVLGIIFVIFILFGYLRR